MDTSTGRRRLDLGREIEQDGIVILAELLEENSVDAELDFPSIAEQKQLSEKSVGCGKEASTWPAPATTSNVTVELTETPR